MADVPDAVTIVTSSGIGAVFAWLGKTWWERTKHRDEQAHKHADRQAKIAAHYDTALLEVVQVVREENRILRREFDGIAAENLRFRRSERRFAYIDEAADLLEEWAKAPLTGEGIEAIRSRSTLFVAKVRLESRDAGDVANELQRRQAAARLIGGGE